MRNEFSIETKSLFDLGGYMRSWLSGRNWANALHHILGRCSNSPYNACPLNNEQEHIGKAMHTFNKEKLLLQKTKKYLDDLGYRPTEKDLEFLEKYKEYY